MTAIKNPDSLSPKKSAGRVHALVALMLAGVCLACGVGAVRSVKAADAQKSALDAFVKPSNEQRYASLDIWSDATPTEGSGFSALPRDPAQMQARMEHMRKVNQQSTPILAQVGAALASGAGPFSDLGVRHVILTGHSQTGGTVTDYILNGHDALRNEDGSPVYHGFFPSGAPSVKFGPCDVPIERR